MSNSPINSRIKAVFHHVDDLDRAVEWYSRILGQDVPPGPHQGPVFVFGMDGGLALILDDNRNNPKGMVRPSAMFDTDDVDAAYHFLKEQGAEIVREIERDPMVSFFCFQDTEGNVAMVCQEHQK